MGLWEWGWGGGGERVGAWGEQGGRDGHGGAGRGRKQQRGMGSRGGRRVWFGEFRHPDRSSCWEHHLLLHLGLVLLVP